MGNSLHPTSQSVARAEKFYHEAGYRPGLHLQGTVVIANVRVATCTFIASHSVISLNDSVVLAEDTYTRVQCSIALGKL